MTAVATLPIFHRFQLSVHHYEYEHYFKSARSAKFSEVVSLVQNRELLGKLNVKALATSRRDAI